MNDDDEMRAFVGELFGPRDTGAAEAPAVQPRPGTAPLQGTYPTTDTPEAETREFVRRLFGND